MNYREVVEFLFNFLPMYQREGNKAFKKTLANTEALCEKLGNPQHRFKSLHVAGTNGKGSCSHMLAAILQSAGYKTGLYTSPHLKQFTERIKVNGIEIGRQEVVDFVTENKAIIERISPSFFEMTVAMAFDHFAKEAVEIAVIEVGLGGRLDSTNVINPEVCLITNIGLDHVDMLGETLPEIALEKAGIIKRHTPVVISEKQADVVPVFQQVAAQKNAPLYFASEKYSPLHTGLKGVCQRKNTCGVLAVIDVLREKGWNIPDSAVEAGLGNVAFITGLKGRWQQLSKNPLIVCDTGHNIEAFEYIISQIKTVKAVQKHLILGFVEGKNVAGLLKLIPQTYLLTFCEPQVPRAMPLTKVKQIAASMGIEANFTSDVKEAVQKVRLKAGREDLIFIGGSTFVVSEMF